MSKKSPPQGRTFRPYEAKGSTGQEGKWVSYVRKDLNYDEARGNIRGNQSVSHITYCVLRHT